MEFDRKETRFLENHQSWDNSVHDMVRLMSLMGDKMILRLLLSASMLLPMYALADDLSKGEDIFERRCASCHSLSRTKKFLDDVKPDDRPAHLKRFLRSHPSKLDDADEQLVIQLLSQP